MKEIPVYLFTGFLESGKTKFIQDTLEDRRFNSGEKTLLLLCEEGEEEYDESRFAGKKVYIETLDDASELNEQNLAALLIKHDAERVVVEYNGMWTIQSLYDAMPEGWLIYQEMMFADGGTFVSYNANMRQLVVDKLSSCDCIVFNRMTPDIEQMDLHKIVRGVSRRADIAYDYKDGHVEYDEYEDPLPFDINAPVIEIGDGDYALWYRDMMEDVKKYDGKTVRFKGVVARDNRMGKDVFAVGRHIMTCCVEDIQYCPVIAKWQGADGLVTKQWVTVEAKIKIEFNSAYRKKGPVFNVLKLEKAIQPDQPVATFY